MPGSYNLRSSQKKKVDSVKQCYLQNFLRSKSPEAFHPIVRLERLQLSDCQDIQSSRFYLKNDQIIVKENRSSVFKKTYLLKIFCTVILILAISFYWKDFLHNYGSTFARKCAEIHPAIQNYYSGAVKFQQKILEQFIYKQQKPITERSKQLISSTKEEEFAQIHNDDQIRQLVRDYFEELNKKHKIQSTKKPSKSFIEDQCKNNVKDKFISVKSNFNNVTIPLLTDFTDYALESQGAKIVSVFNTEPYGSVTLMNITLWPAISQFFMNYLKSFGSNGPNSVLMPWKKPGDCWAFKGSHGRIQIELSRRIVITGITIDHIPKELAPPGSVLSAPKEFSVIGVQNCKNQVCKTYLSSYEYKSEGPAIQTFSIHPKVDIPFDSVEVLIQSNHGNDMYTCVYKIRVHGY